MSEFTFTQHSLFVCILLSSVAKGVGWTWKLVRVIFPQAKISNYSTIGRYIITTYTIDQMLSCEVLWNPANALIASVIEPEVLLFPHVQTLYIIFGLGIGKRAKVGLYSPISQPCSCVLTIEGCFNPIKTCFLQLANNDGHFLHCCIWWLG